MRRSQLHPGLQRVLRGVEHDIDTSSVAALTKYGMTEREAKAYLARHDWQPFQQVMVTMAASATQMMESLAQIAQATVDGMRPVLAAMVPDGDEFL
jgi:ABC-type transporter Mla subunit MlaD